MPDRARGPGDEDPAPGDPRLEVVAVVGPTAVGKTRLAEDLARELDGEIVTADSMQVYRGLDIGTAKTPADHRTVPHHCIDLIDPGTDFSAALYQAIARAAIDDIASRGHLPLVAGGTGLYVRAALDDMCFPGGETSSPSRDRLEAEAAAVGAHAMHSRLATLDPASAALIHPNNVRRTIRALEMAEEGVSYAGQAAGFRARTSVYSASFLGLTMRRDVLYDRIDERVDVMRDAGLLDEVRSLLASDFRAALTAAQAIGYKELVPVVESEADLGEALDSVKLATRRYAKRQLTWFRGDPRVSWIDVTDLSQDETLTRALELLESGNPATYPESC
ncbi:MAG: tRNA (adenosine(37)-N6)-dimethylallyltransferase MiaA [Actinomycetota bacterium]|nr:tRNA (adenosine(37)-N6)-dimethylallyltransferase MiaA [Actinomycetota bacterium]